MWFSLNFELGVERGKHWGLKHLDKILGPRRDKPHEKKISI